MKNIIKLIILGAILSGCSYLKRDIDMPPSKVEDIDTIKPSPCACETIEYKKRSFQWLG